MDARLSRKGFLGLAGGAVAVAAGARIVTQAPVARAQRPTAVVVGAGLAGLTAAYELERAGLGATLVEARDRIGGRVWTIRDAFAGGQHAEAGGEYVDSVHTYLRAYCGRFGLPLQDVRGGWAGLSDLYLYDGEVRGEGFYNRTVSRDVDAFYRRIYQLGLGLDPADPVGTAPDLDAYDAGSLLDKLDLSERGRFLIDSYIRDDYATDPDDLSLLFLAAEERLYRNVRGRGVEFARIRGGNSLLAEAFADRLRDVRLEAPATEVAHDETGVEVTAGGSAVAADFAVLAAPLPALANITFEPALPPALAGAITGISYGRVTKNLLQTRTRVWRELGASGTLVSDLPLGTTWEASDQQPGRRGILLDYASGGPNEHFEALSDSEREDYVRTELDEVFPGSDHAAGGFQSVSWGTEEFTGGAWVAPAPGEMTAHWAALREPAGRLHMAGEHTSVYAGYMEGAIRSGRRAARQIAERDASG